MFEDWMTKMRAARRVPFGTAYETFAREAWNAATIEARELLAGVEKCPDVDNLPATARGEAK